MDDNFYLKKWVFGWGVQKMSSSGESPQNGWGQKIDTWSNNSFLGHSLFVNIFTKFHLKIKKQNKTKNKQKTNKKQTNKQTNKQTKKLIVYAL